MARPLGELAAKPTERVGCGRSWDCGSNAGFAKQVRKRAIGDRPYGIGVRANKWRPLGELAAKPTERVGCGRGWDCGSGERRDYCLAETSAITFTARNRQENVFGFAKRNCGDATHKEKFSQAIEETTAQKKPKQLALKLKIAGRTFLVLQSKNAGTQTA